MQGRVSLFLMRLLICMFAVLAGASTVRAGFEERVFRDDSGEHRYSVFLPEGYTTDRQWPVILFLHGAGERGTDGRRPTEVGLGPAIRSNPSAFPFVVVFPQCEDLDSRYLSGWLAETPDARRALQILDEVESDFSIDPDRRILTGWSMGGYGTWSLAAARPDHWSAVIPLAGGGDPAWAEKLARMPIWAFHGSEDAAIRPQQTRRMIAAIREAGGNPRYTEVTGGGHDIGPIVYGSQALQQWMRDPATVEPTSLALHAPAGLPGGGAADFEPAAEFSGAVTVRLGNQMLDALAMSVPEQLPEDLLSGRIADIYDATVVDGYRFNIVFGDISWSVEPWRIRIQGYQKDRVNIQIGVRNASLRIGGTSVTGSSHSAYAGPIDVVIGHLYPVWLSFDVKPYVEDRRLRLKLLGSRFDIPSDNWYVTYPAGVTTRGFGITREKVSNGLVNGLYGNRRRIEQEVTSIVPSIVVEMEKQLEVSQADQLIGSIWPLPVYRPQLRVWPQDVVADESGVSVVLGISAAAFDRSKSPEKPVQKSATEITAVDVSRSERLDVAVAPSVLQHLTQQLIDANLARIHVLDIPENAFADFVNRDVLTESLPRLKSLPEDALLRTVLHLTQPLEVQDDSEKSRPVFVAPELSLVVSTRRPDEPRWTLLGTLTFGVRQAASIRIRKLSHTRRALELAWVDEPELTVSAQQPNGDPLEINRDRLLALFARCWQDWTRLGPAATTVIPDIDFGLTQLRLSDAAWKPPFLGVTFAAPGLRITNSSDQTLVYETRGPFSDWGGPYTLAPGDFHQFDIAYPLIYRRKTGDGYRLFRLAPGSHSEFRRPRDGSEPQLFLAREDLETEFRDQPDNPEEEDGRRDQSELEDRGASEERRGSQPGGQDSPTAAPAAASAGRESSRGGDGPTTADETRAMDGSDALDGKGK